MKDRQRARREQFVGWMYAHIEDAEWNMCIYCGDTADSVDHVPPLVIIADIVATDRKKLEGLELVLVPSCRECNSLAGDKPHETVNVRRSYIGERLEQKYARLLKIPDWSEEELNELGSHIRDNIENSAIFIKRIRRKIYNCLTAAHLEDKDG